jgi:hypothetical protein
MNERNPAPAPGEKSPEDHKAREREVGDDQSIGEQRPDHVRE